VGRVSQAYAGGNVTEQTPDPPAEEFHRDRREHGGAPDRLDDDQLARLTEEERVEAGLDAYDPDKQYASFTGKLVVMLRSSSISGPAKGGVRRPVDGRPGRYEVQGDTEILTYQDALGHWVVIQAPKSLGWGSARLATFAAGVEVLGHAQPGQG
jgi:hypothetical protein